MQLELVNSNKAYARFSNYRGEEHFVRKLPCIITTRTSRSQVAMKYKLYTLGVVNSNHKGALAILYYDGEGNFRIINFIDAKINGLNTQASSSLIFDEVLARINKETMKKYQNYSHKLEDVSSILFETNSDLPELWYFSLPQKTVAKYDYTIPIIKSPIYVPKNNKQPVDKGGCSKWTADDREQLKKLLLQYGYGRWKSLQRSSTLMGGKLENKSIQQIKAYTNSFIRSLGMSLPPEQKELQTFLLNLIEQDPNQIYLPPNPKDWDYQIPLSQRTVQYTKRLQLLNRVKTLVRKYKQQAMKSTEKGERVNWQGLLNFIPTNHLFGQRPSTWWAKKHDIDLILGVYKYGYANYSVIKGAREYCFAQFQKAHNYQDFPSADNLTRRLKKLMQTIMRIEQNQGRIDFDDDAEESEPDKGWSDNQKRELFNLLVQMGTPLTADGRSNYMELRERMKTIIRDFDKTVGQLEKMAAKIRWTCQQLLTQSSKAKQQSQGNNKFIITTDMANKFNKHMNMLSFIRKTILSSEAELFSTNLADLKQKNQELKPEDLAFMGQNYDLATNDMIILNWINKNGLTGCGQLRISQNKTIARAEWLCQVFKQLKDKNNQKKKKNKQSAKQQKRRTKFQLNRDKQGNIVFPLTINPSLKLVNIGRISTLSSYHSQHNLFPIGFVSIRTHASMVTKGARANYTCEILEGDGRPIYKVTPSQEPDKPIIKDSSTGCWVRICQRVNQLQDVKKEKVTISGTQRFGLLQQNVVRLLQDLPDAEKCSKYKFKYKQVQGQMLQE